MCHPVARRIAVVALVLLGACAGRSRCCPGEEARRAPPSAPPSAAAEAPLPDVAGTYALASINGKPLPFKITHEPPGVMVTAGSMTFRADGTCTSRAEFVLPSGESASREVNATWTRDGDRLTMSWQGAGTTTGRVQGDAFTMENEGQSFGYRRSR